MGVPASVDELERLLGISCDWAPLDQLLAEFLVDPELRRTALASSFTATLEMTREGAVEMTGTPTQESTNADSPPAPTPSQVVSLWQTNSVGILAEVAVNFAKVRTGSVSVLDIAAWTAGSPE